MRNLFVLLFFALLAACGDNLTPSPLVHGLALHTEANPAWQHDNLRLYPILTDYATVERHAGLQRLKTLSEALTLPGFRVMEKKQFGRNDDRWQNALTIQNKSRDTIFLMSGEVVTGGNQDRVFAYDDVIPPGAVKNVEVFCVEPGRSFYYDSTASPAEKQVAAFRGYYHVVSPQVRQAVQRTADQGQVWAAVANVTKANGAESHTGAYAALENANDHKARRDAYIQALEGAFAQPFQDEKTGETRYVVGLVAVCGDRVLGVDVFGHPDLFKREFPHLLHGYAAEAVTADSGAASLPEKEVRRAFAPVAALARDGAKGNEEAGKLMWDGEWAHLWRK